MAGLCRAAVYLLFYFEQKGGEWHGASIMGYYSSSPKPGTGFRQKPFGGSGAVNGLDRFAGRRGGRLRKPGSFPIRHQEVRRIWIYHDETF